MTPKVRDILLAARRDIHAATALHANICDTQALFALDQLITADAARAINFTTAQTDIVAGLRPDEDDTDTEKLPPKPERVKPSLTQAEREELERLRKQVAQDSAIIDGLRAKLEGK
jgi:hypothetical protein